MFSKQRATEGPPYAASLRPCNIRRLTFETGHRLSEQFQSDLRKRAHDRFREPAVAAAASAKT